MATPTAGKPSWLRQRFATRLRRANPGGKTLNNMKKHFVYILQSVKDKKFYTGLSNNIDRRIREHQLGLVKSTKNRRPLKLIHLETFGSKKEATKREKFLKSGQGREILKTLKLNEAPWPSG